jgi:glutathione peroxidase
MLLQLTRKIHTFVRDLSTKYDMKRFQLFTLFVAVISLMSCKATTNNDKNMEKIYDFTALSNKGKEVNFADYEGKVLLIVNTASKCGFTPQYDGLEALYQKYKDQGLVIIGFPCDQFGHQEPGTNEEIEEFCRINHGVTFPLMSKIEVNGDGAHPIYQWLKSQAGFAGFNPAHPLTKILDEMFTKADPDYASKPDIKWNFTKFLISKEGNVVSRFEPTTEPQDMEESIEKELAK